MVRTSKEENYLENLKIKIMTYFIKKNQELSDRNKLDTEIAAHMKQYDHMLCVSKERFESLIVNIKAVANALNAKYPRIQKKISINIREEQNHIYIHISDQLSYIAYKVSHIQLPFNH